MDTKCKHNVTSNGENEGESLLPKATFVGRILTAFYHRDRKDWDFQLRLAVARFGLKGRNGYTAILRPWPPRGKTA